MPYQLPGARVIVVEAPWPEWPAPAVPVPSNEPGMRVRFAVRVKSVVDHGWHIRVELVVGERDTGQPVHASFDYVIPDEDRRLPRVDLVRAALTRAMLHEVDESIVVHGSRPFEPHVF